MTSAAHDDAAAEAVVAFFDPGAAGPAVAFERGDGVEIARRLLVDASGFSEVGVIYDRDTFWRYAPRRGVFEEVPRSYLGRLVGRYAGAPLPEVKGEARALRLWRGDITGAIAQAADEAEERGAFDRAAVGVAFRNGFATVDATGTVDLHAHSPTHRATFALGFDFDPTATAPRWEAFLGEMLEGHPDAAAIVACLEEWIGAALTGDVVRYQVALVLVGALGANGKSTFLTVIRWLFPPGSVQAIGPALWGNVFHLAELAGARINIVNELPDADIAAGEVFKSMISGDAVNAAHKHGKPFTFAARTGHVFACNGLPGTRDQSGGYWRRWLIAPCDRSFVGREDFGLADALRAELPGIAARVVAAAGRLRARGRFEIPATSAAAKLRWQLDSDQVRQFLADHGAVRRLHEANGQRAMAISVRRRVDPRWTRAQHLYEAFAVWAKANGHGPMSSTKFGARVGTLLERRIRNDGNWYLLPETAANDVDADPPEAPDEGSGGLNPPPIQDPPPATTRDRSAVEGVEGVEASQESLYACVYENDSTLHTLHASQKTVEKQLVPGGPIDKTAPSTTLHTLHTLHGADDDVITLEIG